MHKNTKGKEHILKAQQGSLKDTLALYNKETNTIPFQENEPKQR